LDLKQCNLFDIWKGGLFKSVKGLNISIVSLNVKT